VPHARTIGEYEREQATSSAVGPAPVDVTMTKAIVDKTTPTCALSPVENSLEDDDDDPIDDLLFELYWAKLQAGELKSSQHEQYWLEAEKLKLGLGEGMKETLIKKALIKRQADETFSSVDEFDEEFGHCQYTHLDLDSAAALVSTSKSEYWGPPLKANSVMEKSAFEEIGKLEGVNSSTMGATEIEKQDGCISGTLRAVEIEKRKNVNSGSLGTVEIEKQDGANPGTLGATEIEKPDMKEIDKTQGLDLATRKLSLVKKILEADAGLVTSLEEAVDGYGTVSESEVGPQA